MQIEQSIIINCPIGQVFAFVSNPDNNKQWQPEVIEHKMLSDGPMALGSKMRHVSKFMGRRIKSNINITEFAPNKKSRSTLRRELCLIRFIIFSLLKGTERALVILR